MTDVLTTRALNRATLARQMLLGREKTTTLEAVERLVGMQAQLARPPFVAVTDGVLAIQVDTDTRQGMLMRSGVDWVMSAFSAMQTCGPATSGPSPSAGLKQNNFDCSRVDQGGASCT